MPEPRPTTALELTLGPPAAGGGFVARAGDGRVVFVRHGLPGETVRAVLTEEHAKWARADAIEILAASPDRVQPPCAHARPGGCGGCDYQHASLPAQRHLKAQLLAEQLRRVAGIELAVTVEPFSREGLGTRTRVRYGVTETGALGMRRRHSRDLIEVERCPLGVDAITELDLATRRWPAGDDVQVIALNGTDAPTIALVEWSDDDEVEDAATGEAASLLDDDDIGVQWTEAAGFAFRVSADSFFQIHRRAPDVLIEAVLAGLTLAPGDVVLDLYAGVGLFTVPIAEEIGATGMVIAVESSPSATADARVNLDGRTQARVIEGAVTPAVLAPFLANAHAAVIDPPRSGVDKRSLRLIAESDLGRVVMVSCNPGTFSRDLKVLLSAGWTLESLRALDLFEMTEHLEIVAVFSR